MPCGIETVFTTLTRFRLFFAACSAARTTFLLFGKTMTSC